MAYRPIFKGLVFDERDNLLEVSYIGDEGHYVVDDMGFMRHVSAETIDRQVMSLFMTSMQDNKDLAIDQAMKMMDKDDLFTRAALDSEISNVDLDKVMEQPIPPQALDMLGMMGFKITVNYRGEITNIELPQSPMGFGDE